MESIVFSPEGVDRGLIWEALHQTPTERLRVLQDLVNTPVLAGHGDPVR